MTDFYKTPYVVKTVTRYNQIGPSDDECKKLDNRKPNASAYLLRPIPERMQ